MSDYLVLFVADEADDGHADALRETARSLKGAGFFDDPDLGGQRTTGTYLETDTLDDPVALRADRARGRAVRPRSRCRIEVQHREVILGHLVDGQPGRAARRCAWAPAARLARDDHEPRRGA